MSDNYLDTKGKVIFIKRSPYKNLTKKWFWYKSLGVVRGKLGNKKPYTQVDNIQICSDSPSVSDRSELQVGDTCLVKFKHDSSPEVVDVIGLAKNGMFVFHLKNGNIIRDKEIEDFVLISDNTEFFGKPPKPNLIDARSPKELEFFEKIYYLSAIRRLHDNNIYVNFEISLESFTNLHKMLFEKIYTWAGQIRNNAGQELVIGDRNHPTLEPLKVIDELERFFLSLPKPLLMHSRGNKKNLAVALADIHGKLAWIHPFIDGNGRTIRLFCQLIALHFGYTLDLEKLTKKNRSYYNFSIRCHINNHPKHLIGIFDNAMIKIKD